MLAAVVGLLLYLYDNLHGQPALGHRPFDFLDQQAGFRIAYTDFSPTDTVLAAILTGLRNTMPVALVGIVLTLVLGTLIGIARLSGNWVVRPGAGAYVEALRNVPPLLVIIFVNSAALASLPPIEDATDVGGVLLLSVRQIGVIRGRGDGYGWAYPAVLARPRSSAGAVARWRVQRVEATGRPARAGRRAVRHRRRRRGLRGARRPVVLSRPEVVGRAIEGGAVMGAALRVGAGRPGALHLVARGRDRAGLDPGRAQGAERGGHGHRPVQQPAAAPRRAAPGVPHRPSRRSPTSS